MKSYSQSLTVKPGDTLWRTLQTFNVTRVVIAFLLFAYVHLSERNTFGSTGRFPYQETCAIYLSLAVLFAVLAAYSQRRFLVQIISQVVVDIVVISALYIAAGGAKSGLGILYLFPLAGAAILAPLIVALFFVSAVALVLLGESGYQVLHQATSETTSQAGLYGAAFFVAVMVLNRLAVKLITQEQLATQHEQDLRVQQAINLLVIADMGDGVLVVGRDSTVFVSNPAAERMLGVPGQDEKLHYKLTDLPALTPIADAFSWAARPSKAALPEAAHAIVKVKPAEELLLPGVASAWSGRRELVSHLKLRFATVDTAELMKDRTVIFMQDVTEIENHAQQLKLASMGRLTASIAHEVRNPLSAISYAASLLGEEDITMAQARLVKIVGDNVARLDQMIEDILKLSRKAQPYGAPVPLHAALAEIVSEFEETHSLAREIIALGPMYAIQVNFDQLHLREVVVNLLSNAVRYASGKPGSVRLYVVTDSTDRVELHVHDDGPAMVPETRSHLFEPFYTTSSKGTGLGLYVARELCLNNGAMLDYEYRMDGDSEESSGRFVITFALPKSS